MSSEDPTQLLPRTVEEIKQRLAALEDKVAKRGYDTRPIFEAHERQIAALQSRIGELEKQAAEGHMGKLKYIGWAYFAEDGDGPFWRHCYETSDGRTLSHLTGPDSDGDHFCTICTNYSRDHATPSRPRGPNTPGRDPLAGF